MFEEKVDRWCRVRSVMEEDENPFPLDRDGFLNPPAAHDEPGKLAPGMIVRPSAAATRGALVLLGEPGVGKSTVFEDLGRAAHGAAVVKVDGADVTDSAFEDLIGRELRALPEQGSGPAAGLVLILDQVDESPMLLRLPSALRRACSGRSTSGLRVLLACRTADYPASFTQVLGEICGECVVADLAPLTREDAVALVTLEGVDGAPLIEIACALGAGPLASVPLTLSMLVRSFQATGALAGTAASLFFDGIARLAGEHDPERSTPVVTTPDQRVAVAARAAAHLLLSGRRTIWRGHQLGDGPQDLNAFELVGGHETAGAGSFEVTQQVVEDTLGSALFTGRGQGRAAFTHASIAASLAARYLAERRLPREQLESLFLVAGPDGTQTIPSVLRETAAWLLCLAPGDTGWLAAADPESLISNSPVIDPPEARALVVDSILRRAAEVELSQRSWRPDRWRIEHEGLGPQLAAVFDEFDAEPEDWESQARVRVATRMARQAKEDLLVEPLLRVAQGSGWTPAMRARAFSAAFDTSPDKAAATGLVLLSGLKSVEARREEDPRDELVGNLLSELYPTYLDTETAMEFLRPRQVPNLFGEYWAALRDFAVKVPEQDLPLVIEAISSSEGLIPDINTGSPGEGNGNDASIPTTVNRSDASPDGPSGFDPELVRDLINRVLSVEDVRPFAPHVARIAAAKLVRFEQLDFPIPLSLVDQVGAEPASSRDARRILALEICVALMANGREFTGADAWQLVTSWDPASEWLGGPWVPDELQIAPRKDLLDSDDLAWVYEMVLAAANEDLREALITLAGSLYSPMLPSHQEFVYERRDHPAWRTVSHWFDSVPVNSKPEWYTPRRRREEKDRTEEIRSAVLNRLSDASNGDPEAFVNFVYLLRADPKTGHARHFGGDLAAFPGYALLGGHGLETLDRAALCYLNAGDADTDWVETPEIPWRATAGHLALQWLSSRRGDLSAVDESVLARWVASPLAAIGTSDEDRTAAASLIRLIARSATDAFAGFLVRYARGSWARHASAIRLREIFEAEPESLSRTRLQLLDEVLEIVDHVAEVTGWTIGAEPVDESSLTEEEASTRQLATQWLGIAAGDLRFLAAQVAATEPVEVERRVASRWVNDSALMSASAPILMAALLMQTNEPWSNFVADAARRAFPGHREAYVRLGLELAQVRYEMRGSKELADAELADAYRLLAFAFPPTEDDFPAEAHWVSTEEEAAQLRDWFVRELSMRGTEDAVIHLDALVQECPDQLLLQSCRLIARQNFAASRWEPPRPKEVSQLLASASKRLVRSENELLSVIIEVLHEVQEALPRQAELLWDRLPKRFDREADEDLWIPKLEYALAAFISRELDFRLGGRGLVVNREVLIRPTNDFGAGDRTDILVDAAVKRGVTPVHFEPERLKAVIEVKGSWNIDLIAAQTSQLADRYLPDAPSSVGVYLVGWYSLAGWTKRSDYRRRAVKDLDPDELLSTLQEEARKLEPRGLQVLPFLLRIDRATARRANAAAAEVLPVG